MDIHKNARPTPKGRRADRAPSAKRADAEGRRIRRRLPADCPQMAYPVQRRRSGRTLKTAFPLASATPAYAAGGH